MSTSSPDASVPDNGTLRVWFAEGVRLSHVTSRLKPGWWRKHPEWLTQVGGTELVGRWFDTRCRHILLEHGGTVLDVGWTHTTIYPVRAFARGYKGVVGCFEFAANPIPWSWASDWTAGSACVQETTTTQALVSHLAMFCTGGRWRPLRVETCVDVALVFLARVGVVFEKEPWNPPALCRYLLENGHVWHPRLSALPAEDCRRAD